MLNIEKQINYWINGAEDDILTAELLIEKSRNLHGLFFCHLVIEKALKAHFVKKNKIIAPKIHNLLYLSEKSEIEFDIEIKKFLGILMKFQLQGRYPDYSPEIPDQNIVNEYLIKTKELLKWLKQKL